MWTRRIALAVAAAMAAVGIAAAPASAAQACTTLWTQDGAGRISICKTWTAHQDGSGYYGEYWGTIYGKRVVLEAWFDSRQGGVAGSGDRTQVSFSTPYSHIHRLYFRACKLSTSCTTAWW